MAPPAEQRGSGETHSEPTLFFDLSRFADPTLNAAPQQFVRALADTRWKLADSAASATYIVRVQEPAIRDAGIDNETGMHVRVVTGRVLLVDGEHRVRDLGTVRGVGKARGAGPAVELAIRELAQRAIGAVGSRG